ncbi:MAG: Rrf2 family transcriptional regulator [SAR324 cluster bacterium]|nr:Rrf2 family transcriptional regulator [SAR324 cluster bacterium]
MFSKRCSYAIRAVVYLASLKHHDYVSIQEISTKLSISFHFLTKVLQMLTNQHIINSYRGPKGGVALARSAETISLFEIVNAIDGDKTFSECILGLAMCGDDHPCPLHDEASIRKEQMKQLLNTTTIASLAHKVKDLNLRLGDHLN